MLFTGDMEKGEEEQLLIQADRREGDGIREHLAHINLLKTAHHGSSGSSCLAFLEAVTNVRLAVISYGKGNSYGHPDPGVVKRMEHLGIKVLRPAERGASGSGFHKTEMAVDKKVPFSIIKRCV